jgi:hypothetical protein
VNLQELEELSGQPARLIRYLISEEVVPRPSGGKRFASYGDEHVRALSVYREAKDEGVDSLDVIRARIEHGHRSEVFRIADGVEIKIEPGRFEDTKSFVEAVRELANQHLGSE